MRLVTHREAPRVVHPEMTMKTHLDDFFDPLLLGCLGLGSLSFIATLVIVLL
jgi:hypothetical protein